MVPTAAPAEAESVGKMIGQVGVVDSHRHVQGLLDPHRGGEGEQFDGKQAVRGFSQRRRDLDAESSLTDSGPESKTSWALSGNLFWNVQLPQKYLRGERSLHPWVNCSEMKLVFFLAALRALPLKEIGSRRWKPQILRLRPVRLRSEL